MKHEHARTTSPYRRQKAHGQRFLVVLMAVGFVVGSSASEVGEDVGPWLFFKHDGPDDMPTTTLFVSTEPIAHLFEDWMPWWKALVVGRGGYQETLDLATSLVSDPLSSPREDHEPGSFGIGVSKSGRVDDSTLLGKLSNEYACRLFSDLSKMHEVTRDKRYVRYVARVRSEVRCDRFHPDIGPQPPEH